MELVEIKFLFDTIQTLITMGVVITLFVMRGRIATASSIKELSDKLSYEIETQKVKIATLESHISHCPSHNDLADIHEKFNEVAKGIAEITGEIKHIVRGLDNLRENELRKAGGHE